MSHFKPAIHQCDEPHCLDNLGGSDRLALVAGICADRGVQLTDVRAQVLEILWDSGRPMGAYELIDALTQLSARKVNPPTVYRALDFLTEQEFVTKLESRNAFVPCPHPDRPHTCLFFICGECGSSTEIEDSRVERLLTEDAGVLGFQVKHRVIEIEGTCAGCAGSTR